MTTKNEHRLLNSSSHNLISTDSVGGSVGCSIIKSKSAYATATSTETTTSTITTLTTHSLVSHHQHSGVRLSNESIRELSKAALVSSIQLFDNNSKNNSYNKFFSSSASRQLFNSSRPIPMQSNNSKSWSTLAAAASAGSSPPSTVANAQQFIQQEKRQQHFLTPTDHKSSSSSMLLHANVAGTACTGSLSQLSLTSSSQPSILLPSSLSVQQLGEPKAYEENDEFSSSKQSSSNTSQQQRRQIRQRRRRRFGAFWSKTTALSTAPTSTAASALNDRKRPVTTTVAANELKQLRSNKTKNTDNEEVVDENYGRLSEVQGSPPTSELFNNISGRLDWTVSRNFVLVHCKKKCIN